MLETFGKDYFYDPIVVREKHQELVDLINMVGYDNEQVARLYYELYGRHGLDRRPAESFKKTLEQVLPKEGIATESGTEPLANCTVLDLGSGPGIDSEILADKFGKVIAMDKAQAMVDFVNDNLSGSGKIEGRQGDFSQGIPVADQSVEVVIGFNTVSEIEQEDEDKYLKEFARVIRPGGFALLNGIVDAGNLAMRSKFAKEREAEIKTHQPGQPREYVFISSELESRLEPLLAEKKMKAKVEVISDPTDQRRCIVKIIFNKIEK